MDKRGIITAWALCIAWMAVIFAMSAAPGDVSGEHSGMIVQLLAALIPQAQPTAATLEFLVRKGAHMMEYAILFLLYRRALRRSGARRSNAAAFAMTVIYAATDEFHQRFVPGRGPSPTDVLIDAAGALAAWWAVLVRERANRKGCS